MNLVRCLQVMKGHIQFFDSFKKYETLKMHLMNDIVNHGIMEFQCKNTCTFT